MRLRLDEFALHMRARALPEPEREYRFAPPRRWKFDYAFPYLKIAVEQEGVIYPKKGQGGHLSGRHTSVKGFKDDIEKYAVAFALGWTVLRVLPEQIRSGQAADWIEQRLRQC